MKILSLFLFVAFLTGFSAFGQSGIQESINRFVSDASMNHASISFKVIDLATGETIASHHPETTLATASTAKLFSTATALELMGPDYTPKTRVYYDGTIDSSGILNGNVWIRGAGDPALGSKYFYDEGHQVDFLNDWTAQIKAAGITKIIGAVIADASEFGYQGVPDGWNWVDLGNYYGAGPSGLTIYDNLVRYRFSVPSTAGLTAKISSIEPEVPGLVYHNYVESSTRRGDNAYLYGAPYSLDRFGTGTLPVGSSNFLVKGSLPDPEFQFAYELCKSLNAAGIIVNDGPNAVRRMDAHNTISYENKTLILEHRGKQLIDVIRLTNLHSVNLFAEHMINLSGYTKTGDGSTSSGLRVLENYWKNHFDISGMQVNDGSGLSRMNAISADHFVGLLTHMNQSKYAEDFIGSLPIAGVSGTLRNVCKGQAAHNRMVAKSGSMTRIKSYAGYIAGTSGKRYAFALIVNNYTCSSSALKGKMESVFNTIARN